MVERPIFGAFVVGTNRQRPRDDFANEDNIGRFMILDSILSENGRSAALCGAFFWMSGKQ